MDQVVVDHRGAQAGRPGPGRSTGCRSARPATARGAWSIDAGHAAGRLRGHRDRPHQAGRACSSAARMTASACRTASGPHDAPSNLAACGDRHRPDRPAPPAGGSAVTIGAYDGVHLGHRDLLAELGGPAEARPGHGGGHLRPAPGHRGPAGVGTAVADRPRPEARAAGRRPASTARWWSPSTRSGPTSRPRTSSPSPGRRCLGARLVVVGEDFHFGHGRKGNVALLTEMGAVAGFEVDGARPRSRVRRRVAAVPVSSTRIRTLVAEGTWPAPPPCSGARTRCGAPVVHGDGRGGAELGFPTANVEVPAEICLPGRRHLRRLVRAPRRVAVHAAALSVGRRPTFYGDDGRAAGGGLPARLRRATSTASRPGCRSWPGSGGRAALRLGRRAGGPDGPGRRGHPVAVRPLSRPPVQLVVTDRTARCGTGIA